MTELRIGEALVSMLDSNGSPMPVERALIYPPHRRMTPLTPDERGQVIRNSPFLATYMNVIDRDSAYEQLKKKDRNDSGSKNTGCSGEKTKENCRNRCRGCHRIWLRRVQRRPWEAGSGGKL